MDHNSPLFQSQDSGSPQSRDRQKRLLVNFGHFSVFLELQDNFRHEAWGEEKRGTVPVTETEECANDGTVNWMQAESSRSRQ
jgi:hypothetical protein